MELEELKQKLHADIEDLTDAHTLEELALVIQRLKNARKTDIFVYSEELEQELEQSIAEADREELVPHEEAMNWLKSKQWRSQ